MIINLLPKIGFGWTIRCCAFLILALLIFASFTLTSRLEPTKRPIELMAFIRPLKEPAFALWTASVFFFYCMRGFRFFRLCLVSLTRCTGGMFVPFTFIVAHAVAHGMSPQLAQYLVVILNAFR
jgi:hypothetical protein